MSGTGKIAIPPRWLQLMASLLMAVFLTLSPLAYRRSPCFRGVDPSDKETTEAAPDAKRKHRWIACFEVLKDDDARAALKSRTLKIAGRPGPTAGRRETPRLETIHRCGRCRSVSVGRQIALNYPSPDRARHG